ncbi:MAG: hypothetical protein ABSG91_08470 [Syntrophobacteraceae bacterium]|jgi:hypothetical protein
MSSDCQEIKGIYADPNVVHWEYEHYDQYGGVTRRGGKLEAAWFVFALQPDSLRLNEPNVKSRAFSLYFGDSESVVIDYLIEGKVVSSKTIPKANWSCDRDGLTVTVQERTGSVVDKIPSHGTTSRIATVYRVGDQLYVKSLDSADIMLLHVVPKGDLEVRWYRFPVHSL